MFMFQLVFSQQHLWQVG